MMSKIYLIFTLACCYFMSMNYAYAINVTIEADTVMVPGTNAVLANEVFATGGTYVILEKTGSPPLTEGAVSFNVNVVSAGTYKLHVYSFNYGLLPLITADLSINSGTPYAVTLQTSNWAYQDEAKLTLIDILLVPGNNNITLSATSGHKLHMDYFKVTDDFDAYYFSTSGDDITGNACCLRLHSDIP